MKECTTPDYRPVLDGFRNESQGQKLEISQRNVATFAVYSPIYAISVLLFKAANSWNT